MTSYSFGDASAALMDGTGATSASTGPYDSSRAYRRDSGIAGGCEYQHSGNSSGDAAAGVSTGEESFADYLFRQQQPQPSSDISSVVAAVAAAHTSAGSCGAPGISIFQDSPLLHSSSAYAPRSSFGGYSAHRYQEAVAAMSNNQSPSAATAALPSASVASIPAASLTTSPNSVALGPLDTLGSTPSSTSSVSTASCLADPLPSFLSSLPTPMESSKYSSLVAGIASANNTGSAILATAAPTGVIAGSNSASNSLLAAAAAAAAVAASSASATPVGALAPSGNPSSGSHANTSAGSYSHYSAQHQHSHSHGGGYAAHHGHSHGHHYSAGHNSAYDVSALGLPHSSTIAASTPSLSAQVAAAAALAQGAGPAGSTAASALDLHSYSISAFSRPLSQSSPTSAAMIASDATAPALTASVAGNSNSFSGIGQALTQQSAQYSQPPYPQQRSYSDYSAYYRSPSATMGLNTGSTTATGASPMSGTGMNTAATGTSTNNTTQLAAAAAAAAAAMGTGYYASAAAYQPYMRSSVGSGSNAYYYTQPQSRYLPYSAYPPIRHFVSPARPFKCETCDQSFSRNHDLKRHVKIHSGVKPHKCPKCGKSFGRSDALKRHSMVKRCRSSTTSVATAKSTPPVQSSVPAQGMSSSQRMSQLGSQRFEPNAASRLPLHPQLHHVQQQAHSMMQQGVGASGTVMTSVPGSSRLAPVAGSMFGQGGGSGAPSMAMSASTNSIVSSMLTSRTNTI